LVGAHHDLALGLRCGGAGRQRIRRGAGAEVGQLGLQFSELRVLRGQLIPKLETPEPCRNQGDQEWDRDDRDQPSGTGLALGFRRDHRRGSIWKHQLLSCRPGERRRAKRLEVRGWQRRSGGSLTRLGNARKECGLAVGGRSLKGHDEGKHAGSALRIDQRLLTRRTGAHMGVNRGELICLQGAERICGDKVVNMAKGRQGRRARTVA
jgi:hypothetical protein